MQEALAGHYGLSRKPTNGLWLLKGCKKKGRSGPAYSQWEIRGWLVKVVVLGVVDWVQSRSNCMAQPGHRDVATDGKGKGKAGVCCYKCGEIRVISSKCSKREAHVAKASHEEGEGDDTIVNDDMADPTYDDEAD